MAQYTTEQIQAYRDLIDPTRLFTAGQAKLLAPLLPRDFIAAVNHHGLPEVPGTVIVATTPNRPGKEPYFRILDQDDGRNWVSLSGGACSGSMFNSWSIAK